MLDIDWDGDSYRSAPQLSLLPDSLQTLFEINGGDAGCVFMTSAAVASSLYLVIRKRRKKNTLDSNKIKTDSVETS